MLMEKFVDSENDEETIEETVELDVDDKVPAKKVDPLMSEAAKYYKK